MTQLRKKMLEELQSRKLLAVVLGLVEASVVRCDSRGFGVVDHPRYPFFLPVAVLSRVFRGKFVAGLKRRFRRRQLTFAGTLKPLESEPAFRSLLAPPVLRLNCC